MTREKGKKLISQLKYWEKAMRAGLIGGQPFSQSTITVYTYYTRWFLERYEAISVKTFKMALLDIPPEHFGKRQKLFQTLNCLAKYLIEDDLMESDFLTDAKALKPKRHKPAKRSTVSETD